jgi:2-polyprenyl-3-methyl-5-hydroxy-6-metoxy-1,4-benzoquinol methylase
MINHHNWYEHFFNGLALDLWEQVVTNEYTQREIAFFNQLVSLPPEAKVLDVPCGFGRHALVLAAQGCRVTAVDISPKYIAKLNNAAVNRNLHINALHLDVLDFQPETVFDLVLCLGNSFNYFDHLKTKRFIQVLTSALKSGGHIIINTGSLAENVFMDFKKEREMKVGNILFKMSNEYDCLQGALKTEMEFAKDGNSEKKTAFHFAYTLAEINRLMTERGMEITGVYANVEHKQFELGDKQTYLLARKV